MESFDRVKLLIGEDIFDKIKDKKVAIFGLGGVGGPTCDAIARFGISNLLLVDFDVVKESNMNRLSIADGRDIGKPRNRPQAVHPFHPLTRPSKRINRPTARFTHRKSAHFV